jgi:hypothetical protein
MPVAMLWNVLTARLRIVSQAVVIMTAGS